MPSARAYQFAPSPADCLGHDRRMPAFPHDLEPPPDREGDLLRWPASWPATLHAGDSGEACKVRLFSSVGARIVMRHPPPAGARVSLKFPFTIYLNGRVAWSRGEDLGIDFDEDAQRSARIVEEVLLDNAGF